MRDFGVAGVRSSTLHIRAGVGLEWAERLLQAHESFPRFGMDKALSSSTVEPQLVLNPRFYFVKPSSYRRLPHDARPEGSNAAIHPHIEF